MFKIEIIEYMEYGTKNLSTLFAYIFWLYRVPYLMFEIEIIEYMDCGTKQFILSIYINFLTL